MTENMSETSSQECTLLVSSKPADLTLYPLSNLSFLKSVFKLYRKLIWRPKLEFVQFSYPDAKDLFQHVVSLLSLHHKGK